MSLTKWIELTKENNIYNSLQDIGQLTPIQYQSITRWFEPWLDSLIPVTRQASEMVFICGSEAYKALETYTRKGIITLFSGNVTETIEYSFFQYVTDLGKPIVFILDPFLDKIGYSGSCFMAPEHVLSFKGKITFKTDRFVKRLSLYLEQYPIKNDTIISCFDLCEMYTQLFAVASGIEVPDTIKNYDPIIEFDLGKVGVSIRNRGNTLSLVLNRKGVEGEYEHPTPSSRIRDEEETQAILTFNNKNKLWLLIEELLQLYALNNKKTDIRPHFPTIVLDNVTRLEVISETEREYVMHDIEINEYSLQDEGRTLKLFINHNEKGQ